MDNNVNMANMDGNPGGANGVGYDQIFGACKFLIQGTVAAKLEKLKGADFNGPEKFGLVFLTEFVKPVAESLGLTEELNASNYLKVENIDSMKAKNILLAISEVIYDSIQDEECFNALLENLSQGQREIFEKNREILLNLRKEDIRSVVDKLAKIDFFSKVECVFQQIVKKEFRASDLKSVFWDVENTRGKVGKGLAIAEFVVTCFVAVSSCFLYVGFLFLDNYIDKKVDATKKLDYSQVRGQLANMKRVLKALPSGSGSGSVTKTQAQIKDLDKRCSSLSGNLTDKLARLGVKEVNKYELKKSILPTIFCLLCPVYLLKKGISLLRKVIDSVEERKFFEKFKGRVDCKPKGPSSLGNGNSTLDNTLSK